MAREKQTIVWDVDDVLNGLTRTWFECDWLKTHPDCRLKYSDLTENPPHKLFGVGHDEYVASLDNYRLSGAYAVLPPVSEVMEWFKTYGDNFRHIALSAPPLKSAHISAEWVLRNYGRWIRSFNIVPSARAGDRIPEYDSSKKDFLAWLGKGDVFVDDNMDNVAGAAALGLKSVLITHPWNNGRRSIAESLEFLTAQIKGANLD